jgi:hypothetical protein
MRAHLEQVREDSQAPGEKRPAIRQSAR